jgi:hypothetical protein
MSADAASEKRQSNFFVMLHRKSQVQRAWPGLARAAVDPGVEVTQP